MEDTDSVCVHPLFMYRWFDQSAISRWPTSAYVPCIPSAAIPTMTPADCGGPGSRPAHGGWDFELPRAGGTRLGISFSGGGIRSATFSLGVYQRLAEAGIFQRARFLSAVSGGSYLASGLADLARAAPRSRSAPGSRLRGAREL